MHCVVVAVRDVAVVVGCFKVKIAAERVDWRLALHFPTVPAGAAVGVGIVGRATVLERGHGGCVVVLVKKEMTTIKLGFAGNASGNHENILECLSNPDFEPVLRMLGVVIGSKVSIHVVCVFYEVFCDKWIASNNGVHSDHVCVVSGYLIVK